MTVREALTHGASVLSGTGSDTSYLDSCLLLSRAAGWDRAALLARNPDTLSPDAETAFLSLLARRASGESVAYILGEKEFYGRSFRVDSRVLVPRPDTELLVEAALEVARRNLDRRRGAAVPDFRIHDAFTGSGCVGITLAAELPDAEVSLSDISPGARDLAAANVRALLGRDLEVFESDALSAVRGPFDLITANPPYLTRAETDRLQGSDGAIGVRREPRGALYGGPDGLGFYLRLVPEAEKALAPGGFLVVEIGEEQGAAVRGIFRENGFREIETLRDLAGRDRVVRGMRG